MFIAPVPDLLLFRIFLHFLRFLNEVPISVNQRRVLQIIGCYVISIFKFLTYNKVRSFSSNLSDFKLYGCVICKSSFQDKEYLIGHFQQGNSQAF